LNYGYGFLEAECRMAINVTGLEPSVGFLHDFSDYQTKQSLVYDLQEPFRWLIDLSVVEAFESGKLDLHDFYFTSDDYRYRFETKAKQRFIDLIRERFNSGVRYKGRVLKWDTVIREKTSELASFLTGKTSRLDFEEPSPTLQRFDSIELRDRIIRLSSEEAKELKIPKQTLHDLRTKARDEQPFRLYGKVRDKLGSLTLQP